MFDGFNKPFAPARTKSDWLSRDPAEVDAYVADPLCGFDVTNQLAIDLLDALPGLFTPERLAPHPQGPADLCLFRRARSGRGQHPGPHRGAEERGLHQAHDPHLSDARHETLNETNRDEVTRDLIAWLDGVVGK